MMTRLLPFLFAFLVPFAVSAQSLPSWAGVKLETWNYTNDFFPSQWGEAKLGGYNWQAANASISGGTLLLSVSEKASAQVQANQYYSHALWEIDVVLPQMRSGLVAAPLWLMSRDKSDEVDFEFLGTKGLTLTTWTNVNGVKSAVWSRGPNQPIIPGNLSGKRYKLGIEYEAGKSITYYVDGQKLITITSNDTKGSFPSLPMKAFFDLWAANGVDPGWAGAWQPLSGGEQLTMQVLGYKVTAL
ncbi:family 16 glycosylhydrolase [Rhizobium sp. CG4]|jgi:hypothetical protein|uniref:family 16 glycosylhydrolase n=1 Tax=Rhizobium/Agrobacterium group TaxID=227290 RepID=UPI00203465FD|nr:MULTISPECIES: family 16 glycosylhydrolase [Rhizobium/Agrobacterium group]MCM2458094.1 family 16 glycosylhydrolase [Rhizobium sp. CG4]MCS4243002.1 hypothetical protein [Rhizobium sp. BIGb0125]MDO5897966.1 family 16 glycosylhydrolase [Agrobacterium sp. Azo12]